MASKTKLKGTVTSTLTGSKPAANSGTQPIAGTVTGSWSGGATPVMSEAIVATNKDPAATTWPSHVTVDKPIAQETGNASNTPQTGGYGNATINPYSNAYSAYQTAMGKVKDAKLGQLETEYNAQQKQIEGAYQNLGRNAYVTYMQRVKDNNQRASNMGVNRTGMAENMATANAVDYNRSIGNVGAYRQNQLSNAENAYNSNVSNVENEHAANMADAENEYRQLEIARQNQLADLQQQMDFQAQQSALDREQQQREYDRAYEQQRLALQDEQYRYKADTFYNTIDKYTTKEQVQKKIDSLKDKKAAGELSGWEAEYYNDMMDALKVKKSSLKK